MHKATYSHNFLSISLMKYFNYSFILYNFYDLDDFIRRYKRQSWRSPLYPKVDVSSVCKRNICSIDRMEISIYELTIHCYIESFVMVWITLIAKLLRIWIQQYYRNEYIKNSKWSNLRFPYILYRVNNIIFNVCIQIWKDLSSSIERLNEGGGRKINQEYSFFS